MQPSTVESTIFICIQKESQKGLHSHGMDRSISIWPCLRDVLTAHSSVVIWRYLGLMNIYIKLHKGIILIYLDEQEVAKVLKTLIKCVDNRSGEINNTKFQGPATLVKILCLEDPGHTETTSFKVKDKMCFVPPITKKQAWGLVNSFLGFRGSIFHNWKYFSNPAIR